MSDLSASISSLIDAAPEQAWVPADFAHLGTRAVVGKTLAIGPQYCGEADAVLVRVARPGLHETRTGWRDKPRRTRSLDRTAN